MTDVELLCSVISKSTKINGINLYKPSCFPNRSGANSDSLFVVKSTDTLSLRWRSFVTMRFPVAKMHRNFKLNELEL